MKRIAGFRVLFVAGFGPVSNAGSASRGLYMNALGIGFKEERDGYLHTEALRGAKSFALWPLSQAALSCFGRESWPHDVPVPQAWLECDVDSVEGATAELESLRYRMARQEQEEAMESDRQPLLGAGGAPSRDHLHAVDARRVNKFFECPVAGPTSLRSAQRRSPRRV